MKLDPSTLKKWLKQRLSTLLGIDINKIDDQVKFSTYGLNSTHATLLAMEISKKYKKGFSPTAFYAYPNLETLVAKITESTKTAQSYLNHYSSKNTPQYEPIAIIGMACRFPQANTPDEFWQLLESGRDAITEVPSDRWNIDEYYDSDPTAEGKTNTRHGAFIDGIDAFDPFFFDISPREAQEMSQSQRLMLEIVWEALSNARISTHKVAGSKTGVFIGNVWNDFERTRIRKRAPITQHSAVGQSASIIANRVSYAYGFRGPSIVLDSACSSSLLAVHLACNSIQEGDSELAIAGGINIMIEPDDFVALTKFGGLSPTGRCHTFDELADGYVRGEGMGVVVLKKLSEAEKDRDKIYGVIRGSAINNDGYSNGLTAPNIEAQKEVLIKTYSRAGWQPEEVQYIETHGTGTKLGDPIEAEALGKILGRNRSEHQKLILGAVKTNIGHLEGAAGIAGLIKVLLCLQHKEIPQNVGFQTPNPLIPFDDLKLQIPTKKIIWKSHDNLSPRKAGISAFGWGGTNAHLAIEEYVGYETEIFTLSADSGEEIYQKLRQIKEKLIDEKEALNLKDLCAEFATMQQNKPKRLAFKVNSMDELDGIISEIIDTQDSKKYGDLPANYTPKVAFVCAPYGGQYIGMCQNMYRESHVFRTIFEACDFYFKRLADWSLKDKMFNLTEEDTEQVDICVPIIFAVQVSLAEQYKQWGIMPSVVIGHSIGEIAAAHIAGFLTLEDAVSVVYHYSHIINDSTKETDTTMAVVHRGIEVVEKLLEDENYQSLEIAGYNSAKSVNLGGNKTEIASLLKVLHNEGVGVGQIQVHLAAHTSFMQSYHEPIKNALKNIKSANGTATMYSTSLGKIVTAKDITPEYWAHSIQTPVLFYDGIKYLTEQGTSIFIELGAHSVLRRQIKDTVEDKASVYYALHKNSDDWLNCQNLLHVLFLKGVNIDWKHFYSRYIRHRFHSLDNQPAEELLLPISAKTEYSLQKYVGRYVNYLKKMDNSLKSLYDICASAATRTKHFDYRVAFHGKNKAEILKNIQYFQEKNSWKETYAGKLKGGKKIAFVFPGQGGQWQGMGRDLFDKEKVFERTIRECNRAFGKYINPDKEWSILEFMTQKISKEDLLLLQDIDVIQPLTFAIQIALAQLWKSWGIYPSSVIGHSMGEVAAAYIAGFLSLDAAAQIICTRSQLMHQTTGQGGMLLAEITVNQAKKIIADYQGKLSIAVTNSEKSTVLSGDSDAIDTVINQLVKQDIFAKRINVTVASHSRYMDVPRQKLIQQIEGISSQSASIPMYSTVRSKVLKQSEINTEYWGDNLRNAVRFNETVYQMIADDHTIFIEISPHPVLSIALRECLTEAGIGQDSAIVASTFRGSPDMDDMIHNMADVYCQGANIDWDSFYRDARSFVELPPYPWHREHYEIEDKTEEYEEYALIRNTGENRHPLLAYYIQLAEEDSVNIWETRLNLANFDFLQHYKIHDQHLFPVAAYMEMLEAAIEEIYGEGDYAAHEIFFRHPLQVGEKGSTVIQLKVTQQENKDSYFRFYQATQRPNTERRTWKLLAEGAIEEAEQLPEFDRQVNLVKLISGFEENISKEEFYNYLAKFGYYYGKKYQCIENVWKIPNGIVGQIIPTEAIKQDQKKYKLHPMLIDACFKVLWELLPQTTHTQVDFEYVISELNELHIADFPEYRSPLWVEAYLETSPILKGNFTVYDTNGEVIAKAKDIVLTRKRTQSFLSDWLYETTWSPLLRLSNPEALPENDTLTVVFVDGRGICDALIEKLRLLNLPYVMVTSGYNFKIHKNKRNGKWHRDYQINPSQFSDFEEFMWYLSEDLAVENIHFVYAWTLEAMMPASFALDGDFIETKQEMVSIGLIHLQQVCATLPKAPAVTLITSGVCKVQEVDTRLNIIQAPAWGMTRIIANEFPAQRFRAIDLSFMPSMEDLDTLLRDLFTFSDEIQIAIRGDKQYTCHLERNITYAMHSLPEIHLQAKGIYLVVGVASLGITFTEWMFEKGARNFVLLSRDGEVSDTAQQKIEHLTRKGAKFWLETGDISNIDELEEIIQKAEDNMPIRGVIHAAGIFQPQLLVDADKRRFSAMTEAKIKGTWNLHILTKNRTLDLFVLFSSISVLTGSKGMSYYTAGNYFLNAFTQYRHLEGLPATCINWGATTEKDSTLQHSDNEGLIPFRIKEGVEIFEEILQRNITQTSIAKLNLQQLTQYYDSPANQVYFHKLSHEIQGNLEMIPQNFKQALVELPKTQRLKYLEEFLKEQIGLTVKMNTSDISPIAEFKQLGIDSLMAVQLRNSIVEKAGINVSVTTFWAHPTLRDYAKFLLSQIKNELHVSTTLISKPLPLSESLTTTQEQGKDLDNLSIDELSSELAQELAEFDL